MILEEVEQTKIYIKRCEGDISNNINSHSKLNMYNEKLEKLMNSDEYKKALENKKIKEDLDRKREEEKQKKREFKKRVDKIYKIPTKEDVNHRKPFTDEDLEDIFLSGLDYPMSHHQEKLFQEVKERIRRTWKAIEGVVRVRDSYLETGKIRKDEEFYQEVKEDGTVGLDKTGEQMKRILDKLIKEGKLISRI